jgi:hypothetical protein
MVQCYRQRQDKCWHAATGLPKNVHCGWQCVSVPLSGDSLVKLTTLGGCTCQWIVVAALPTITWTAEKHVHPGCQKPHRINKARSMGFYHACDMLRLSRISVSALHCCRGNNWLTTRHAKQKKNCHGNILHLLQQINSKQRAQVKNIMETVFWGHKCVLFGYAVTAECCGKPGRLPETIPCQTPGLLRPDVVILYDNARPHNATWICTLLRYDSWKIIEHPPYFRSRAQWFSSLSNR